MDQAARAASLASVEPSGSTSAVAIVRMRKLISAYGGHAGVRNPAVSDAAWQLAIKPK
ncbi:hypothetical protein [Hydrocarboniphaga sp.]|uniref:hypothetical protein n=1 Tax=Hydrocarboniphaga sp. TaxID=2033016 RepID=UPI003D0CADE3